MASIFDKYLNTFLNQKTIGKKSFLKFLEIAKKNSTKVSNKGKIKFEIEKTKLELKKKYYELGKYIAAKFKDEEVSDFTYDENFSRINQEISHLKKYILKIKEQKIRL